MGKFTLINIIDVGESEENLRVVRSGEAIRDHVDEVLESEMD